MADITFIGNVGRDAEIKFPKNGGQAFATFSVCDSKSRKNGDEWETLAEQWFNVTLFGPTAEVMGATIRKGDRVKVAGEMYERKYEKQDGTSGTSLDMIALGVSVLPKRNNGGNQQPQQAAPQQSWGGNQQSQPPADPWQGQQGAFQTSQGNTPF